MSGQWKNSTRSSRLPKDWQRIRRIVLQRDPTCTTCGKAPSQEVHHADDRDNHNIWALRGICVSCHKQETQREAAQARAAKPKLARPREAHPGLR